MSDWKEWKSIEKLRNEKENISAVYQIRMNPEFASNHLWYKDGIPRLLDYDDDYILSIGKTNDIKVRIRKFKTAMNKGRDKTHSEGRTLFLINKDIKFKITIADVEYRYRQVKEPDIEEKKEFKDYFEKYGEVPPLNGCIPGRKEWIESYKY